MKLTCLMKNSWRAILRTNIRSVNELGTLLKLPKERLLISPDFPLNLPRRLAQKIEPGNFQDPILRQFVPLQEETQECVGFTQEPVQDPHFRKEGGLLQKYEGRALIVSTGVCAMHCRYCFRKNYDYLEKSESFTEELNWVRKNESIQEVLLSGGDPFSLSTRALEDLLKEIDAIPHVQRIRFHTRFLIGIPERVTAHLLEVLARVQKQLILVVHVNHARELDEEVFASLKRIQQLGIPLLNQAVLLRGVNDSIEAQQALLQTLINHGIIPYYLHQLDKVQGAAHFEVPIEKGLAMIKALRERLPGYAIPQYVQEIPREHSKTPLTL